MRQCGKIWYSQTGHRWQYNTAHALCVLYNWGYRHTLRIRNTYCFSTVKNVTRNRVSVTLYVYRLSSLSTKEERTSGVLIHREVLAIYMLEKAFFICMQTSNISDVHRGVGEVFVLLGRYTVQIGCWLLTFRFSLSHFQGLSSTRLGPWIKVR
jgi:hypothetical protein